MNIIAGIVKTKLMIPTTPVAKRSTELPLRPTAVNMDGA